MKKFFVTLCAAMIGLGLLSFEAEARRLGGGGSFGMKRDSSVMQRQAAPAPTAPSAIPAKPAPAATPQAPAPQPSGMSRWLGPIAGIAAGIGLAALLSHFGMGEGFSSIIMMMLAGVAVVFVVRLLMRRAQPQAVEYAGAGAPARFETAAPVAGAPASAPIEVAAANIPAGFDVDGFLRNAKLNYVRLQAANDAGNMNDIREFTTPEMYAEIKMQFDERGHAAQTTDVMQLNAQLLDLTTEEKRHIASVRFNGMIREEANAAPENFDEVWHMTKPADGSSGWVIAGIQQVQ